jgi:hypothetical protein
MATCSGFLTSHSQTTITCQPSCRNLATGESESPLEIARRAHDYPLVLNEVSEKARRTFGFPAAIHGSGRQVDLAAELMASSARITQLKAELAAAQGTGGYALAALLQQ